MNEQQMLELLRATVRAKLAYWDELRKLELALTNGGEFSDKANDQVIADIDTLAAGLPLDNNTDAITSVHLDNLKHAVAEHPIED
jgi:hypothetical protein